MCLTTRSRIPAVTTKSMTVYKIVIAHRISKKRVTINSYYHKWHKWQLGRIYSLSNEEIQKYIINDRHYYGITKGFHFYKEIPECSYYEHIPTCETFAAVLEGVIPAGSNIWTSIDGNEIASDCFVPKSCYVPIQRKPILGIKRKLKKVYYDSDN